MKTRKILSETGQSMVIIVVGIIAFIGILALVLDGGNAYAAKRQAQNAADSGAIAGASYMCKNHDQAGGRTTAITYAVSNGADNPPQVAVDLNTATVVVTATVTKNTFFAGVIGFSKVTPRAVAEAACQSPVGTGVMPVAWSCRDTANGGNILPGYACVQKTIDDCHGNPYDLNCTYIMMDSVKVKGKNKNCNPDDPSCYIQNDLVCSPQAGTPPNCYPTDSTKIDCDLTNDCVDELMTGGARSWLDLNGSGGGANDLRNWLKNGYPDPIPPHKWVPSENGVTTSIFHTAAQYTVGKDEIMPVFNKVCDGVPTTFENPETTAQCGYGPVDDLSITKSYTNFHIISFSEFHVTCVQTGKNRVTAEPGYLFNDHNGKDCNGHAEAANNGSIDDNDKTIEGYFKILGIGGYGGPGPWFDTGTFTVILVH